HHRQQDHSRRRNPEQENGDDSLYAARAGRHETVVRAADSSDRDDRGGHRRPHDEPRHDPPTGPGAGAAQQPPRAPRMVRSTAVGSAAAARDPVVGRRHWFHGRSKRASLVPTTSQRPGSPSGSPSTQKPPIVMSYPWVGSMATVQPSFLRYARVVQPGSWFRDHSRRFSAKTTSSHLTRSHGRPREM